MSTITLDLTPYDVAISGNEITILDCSGSILGKLDTDASTTGNRFSVDREYTEMSNGWWMVNYDKDEESCTFTPCSSDVDENSLDVVSEWISDNYSAIESIEYEVLQGDPDR